MGIRKLFQCRPRRLKAKKEEAEEELPPEEEAAAPDDDVAEEVCVCECVPLPATPTSKQWMILTSDVLFSLRSNNR